MKRIILAALACTSSLLALTACNDDNNHSPPGTGEVRVVNGIPDSGSLTASPTSGDVFNSNGQGFDDASGAQAVPEGNYNVQLKNSDDTGSFATIDNVKVSHNTLTALWARGSLAASTGTGFAVQENLGSAPANQFTFIFVNDSTGTTALDVYLVPSGTSTSDLTATGIIHVATAVAAGSATTSASVANGNYEVIVTAGGLPIFDSGSTAITFPASGASMVQLGALDASSAQVTSNVSPITLMLLDNGNNDQDSKLYLNTVAAAT
jgi:hypothetical protein